MRTYLTTGIFAILIWLYTLITYIANIVLLIGEDFEAPWKMEILRGLGLIIPPINWITVWM